MKKRSLILFILLTTIYVQKIATTIQAIFIDVEVVFQTDVMTASSYIGKFNSLRYAMHVGNVPSQEDLFRQLQSVKSISTQYTYNDGLTLPLILSDWLIGAQTNTQITNEITQYIENKDISNIEKKVILAIVTMMLTPSNLADTQSIPSQIDSIIQRLYHKNYNLYLVGNWANIESMQQKFPNFFSMFKNIFISKNLQLLQPHSNFYAKILKLTNLQKNQTLWIEKEPNFITSMKYLGYQTIQYNHGQYDQLTRNLQALGIAI